MTNNLPPDWDANDDRAAGYTEEPEPVIDDAALDHLVEAYILLGPEEYTRRLMASLDEGVRQRLGLRIDMTLADAITAAVEHAHPSK